MSVSQVWLLSALALITTSTSTSTSVVLRSRYKNFVFVTELTVIIYSLQILKARTNANKMFYNLSEDEKCFTKITSILIVISSILKRGFDNQSVSTGWRVGKIEAGKQEFRREEKSLAGEKQGVFDL